MSSAALSSGNGRLPAPGATAPAPVVILGGGPIGMVCALLLARNGIACELLDARPLEALQRDRRLLALSRGTLLVLQTLLGKDFAPMAPIAQVQVSSRGQLGSARLDARDFAGVALGATLWYADLVAALGHAVAAAAGVNTQRPRRAVHVAQRADGVAVALDDGTVLAGALAIDAEGTPPRQRDADQTAILAEVLLEHARPGDAFERFTREGPLALLPLPGSADVRRLSMIWCLPTAVARQRMELPEAELRARLNEALGARIGPVLEIGPCHAFALHTHRLQRVCEQRLVHLGNAAQTLHPVAGQGFNLGIRDCVCLADVLRECAGDIPLALQRYERRRRVDRHLVPALTGALPGLFATGIAPVAAGRSLALAALDVLPTVRRGFARLLMFGTPR